MWIRRYDGNDIHVIPKNDDIAHEPKNCVCIPEVTGVVESRQVKWLYSHSSLDGRELKE